MPTARPRSITVGVDPGGRYTGIVRVAGPNTSTPTLLGAQVVTRPGEPGDRDLLDDLDLPEWCHLVVAEVGAQLDSAAIDLAPDTWADPPHLNPSQLALFRRTRTDAVDAYLAEGTLRLAVEGVVTPNPHIRVTNPGPAIATAAVLGAIVTRWPWCTVVAVGQNGSGPPDAYPAAIAKGTRGLGGPTAHARSAFDVALRERATASFHQARPLGWTAAGSRATPTE